jgi:hypothetical protein
MQGQLGMEFEELLAAHVGCFLDQPDARYSKSLCTRGLGRGRQRSQCIFSVVFTTHPPPPATKAVFGSYLLSLLSEF